VSSHSRHGAITLMSGLAHNRRVRTHLVVALAGGTMRHGVGAKLAGNLDLTLGDQRPGIEVRAVLTS